MTLEQATIEEALKTLGTLLDSRGLRYKLVAVGGGSLMLLGLLTRPTRDIDVVALVEGNHYVSADRGPNSKHFADLQKLQPSEQELITAAGWARSHDVSELFHQTMLEVLTTLGIDGHDRI